jgi:hypothetical protein
MERKPVCESSSGVAMYDRERAIEWAVRREREFLATFGVPPTYKEPIVGGDDNG